MGTEKKSTPENDELYHQKLIEQYEKEGEAAEKSAEKADKSASKSANAYKKYLKQMEKAAKEARDKELRDIDFNHQMGYISDEKYYATLASLRDKYFAVGSKEWQKYTKEINKYHLKLIEKQKEDIITLYDEIAVEAAKAIDDVDKKYEKLTSKLSSATPIATKITSTFVGQGAGLVMENGAWRNHKDYIVEEYRLTDFNEEIKNLEKLYIALSAVKEKGISADFWNSFTNLGMEDVYGTAAALLSMNDEEFNSFYSSWQKYQDMSKKTAYMMTEPDREDIISKYGSLGDDLRASLEETFGTIPEKFYEYGILSAEEFGKGFAKNVNTVSAFVESSIGQTQGNSDTYGDTSNTYNFYGSDKTDAERLLDVKRFKEITKMRGE